MDPGQSGGDSQPGRERADSVAFARGCLYACLLVFVTVLVLIGLAAIAGGILARL